MFFQHLMQKELCSKMLSLHERHIGGYIVSRIRFIPFFSMKIYDTELFARNQNRYAATIEQDILVRRIKQIAESRALSLKESFKKEVNEIKFSHLKLHHSNSPKNDLHEIKQSMKKGEWLVCTIFGGRTLYQLKKILFDMESKNAVSPRVIPMVDVKDAGMIMQSAGFSDVIADIEAIDIHYKNFKDMLYHPKKIGQANCLNMRNKNFPGKDFIANAEKEANTQCNGEFINTFEVITLTGQV